MYMTKVHNQDDWVVKRSKRKSDWNAKKIEGKGASVVSPMNTPTNRKAVSNIALSKSFKYTLLKKLQLSDRETKEIFDSAMADAANEDS